MFELEDMKTGPNTEPLLTELLHQAAYKNNTLGLPGMCPEENLRKIEVSELRDFLSSHYTPSRMVLTGVNVDHEQLVGLAREHFVNPETVWKGEGLKGVDGSTAQYNSGEVKVRESRFSHGRI
jgi:processing peptidase subunit alpha